MKRYAIVVAGGKGLRMGGDVPKQFIPIHGEPVLMRTLRAFREFDSSIEIILVLPSDQHSYWKSLCQSYGFDLSYQLANGGETRFHSVRNGLSLVTDETAIVAIHDGVRPFVSMETLRNAFETAEQCGTAVPVVELVDSVRRIGEQDSVAVDRSALRLVQTPQIFYAEWLKKAYKQPYTPMFTDDASVMEAFGFRLTLTQGNRENIKITTPFDLKIAEVL